uniref:Uncharacterized protein n=1 Tax=Phytophthora ramorum TaxID=164328 RepID=H3G572_PHYRM
FKWFYGMSSSGATKKYNGGVVEYRAFEGKSVTVPYRGAVAFTYTEIWTAYLRTHLRGCQQTEEYKTRYELT